MRADSSLNDPLRSLRLLAWGALLSVALLLGAVAAWRAFMPVDSGLPVLPLGGDVTLTDTRGQAFPFAAQRGQVLLVSFGFTSCPDICPLTLARYRAVLAGLAQDGERLTPVMISVDPARDTPQRLHDYVRYFHPRIIGLTGTSAELAVAARRFGAVIRVPAPGEPGQVMHSDYLYLIDTEGRVRRLYDQQAGVETIVREVRALLREAR